MRAAVTRPAKRHEQRERVPARPPMVHDQERRFRTSAYLTLPFVAPERGFAQPAEELTRKPAAAFAFRTNLSVVERGAAAAE
jgi:hypothetical protein